MRISDWSSDVCSSDLDGRDDRHLLRQLSRPSDSGHAGYRRHVRRRAWLSTALVLERASWGALLPTDPYLRHRDRQAGGHAAAHRQDAFWKGRSEEHTSELQSLMRISYAVFCLKKKN